MNTKTLIMIYYALFHSLINYGIIAWGGAYENSISILQNIQNKVLKIIKKNNFLELQTPLSIRQSFHLQSINHHYEKLRKLYSASKSSTRYKSLQLPKNSKTVSNRNSELVAIKIFNKLPISMKNLTESKKSIKKKLKKFILSQL